MRNHTNSPQSLNAVDASSLAVQGFERSGHRASYGDINHEQFDNEAFDPIKLFWIAIRHRWVIAACLTAGVLSGLMYSWMQTPLYRAENKLEIVSSGAKVIQDLDIVAPDNPYVAVETAREKLKSRNLARRVVFELNLIDNDRFIAPSPQFSISNIGARIIGKDPKDSVSDLTAQQREVRASNIVQRGLSSEVVRHTNILTLSFVHANAKLAADVVNQAAKSFIDQSVDQKSETSNLARQFVEEQVSETKLKLEDSEKALVEYAQAEGITLSGEDASLIVENILALNKGLSEVIQERLALERFVAQVKEGNSETLPAVFASASIQRTRDSISALRATFEEKLATLKPGFPEMRRIQAQIDELKNQLQIEIAAIGRSMIAMHDQVVAKEQSIRDELARLESQQVEFQKKNIQYTILKREVDSNRLQYDSLIAKMNDVGVGSNIRSSGASLVDPAMVPSGPYSPRVLVNLIIGLALFSAIAAAIIYILEMLNNTFSVPDQVESELGLPVLGVIPKVDAPSLAEELGNDSSGLSEAYRTLRTSLQFTEIEESGKVLLVTSSEPTEGKSTAVFKLAKEFSALGRNILVIDADMRRPKLHRYFGTDNGLGLSNLLSNVVRGRPDAPVFRRTSDERITFLPCGTIPPNPVDLLASERMGLMLHFCARKYDMVIVDSAPVMGLSDAPILSRHAGSVLFVVSSNNVTRRSAQHALRRLQSAGSNVVGAALTGFLVNKLDYNHAYRYLQSGYYTYSNDERQLTSGTSVESHHPNPATTSWFSAMRARFDRRLNTAKRA